MPQSLPNRAISIGLHLHAFTLPIGGHLSGIHNGALRAFKCVLGVPYSRDDRPRWHHVPLPDPRVGVIALRRIAGAQCHATSHPGDEDHDAAGRDNRERTAYGGPLSSGALFQSTRSKQILRLEPEGAPSSPPSTCPRYRESTY